MRKKSRLLLALLSCALPLALFGSGAGPQPDPIAFVPNLGQFQNNRGKALPDLQYVAEYGGMQVFFFKDKVSYVFREAPKDIQKEALRHSLHGPEWRTLPCCPAPAELGG